MLVFINNLKKNVFSGSRLAILILVTGTLFIVYLQTLVTDEVFFSGDGGLKLLQVKQINKDGALDLKLAAPAWVHQLYAEGFYPFAPPFVYQMRDQYFICFPIVFAWISAPFYKWFGYRGLYIIPFFSVWLVWLNALWLSRRLGLGDKGQALVLAGLIASPLTVYSAMFWEHAPAVALAFGGLSIILTGFNNPAPGRALLAGVLIGVSAWLRPEHLCLSAVLTMGLLLVGPGKGRHYFWWTIIAIILTVLAFFGLNILLYGHPLGLQGRQVVEAVTPLGTVREKFSLLNQLANGLIMLSDLGWRLLTYFPLALAVPFLFILSFRNGRKSRPEEFRFLGLICLGFFFLVPFILPLDSWLSNKQWGPRFILVLIAFLAFLSGWALSLGSALPRGKRVFMTVGLITALVLGGVTNTYLAAADLRRNYSGRVKPTVDLLRRSEEKVVAVALQHLAQEMATLFDSKYLFLARQAENLTSLGQSLADRNILGFHYVRHFNHQAYTPEEEGVRLSFKKAGKTYHLDFEYLGRFKYYHIYRVLIKPDL